MALPQILQMLGQSSAAPTLPTAMPQAAKIRQMIGAIKNAGDPRALLQQMMQQQNPGLAQAMDYVRQHGGDPKAAFEALAAEKGIDPADLGL